MSKGACQIRGLGPQGNRASLQEGNKKRDFEKKVNFCWYFLRFGSGRRSYTETQKFDSAWQATASPLTCFIRSTHYRLNYGSVPMFENWEMTKKRSPNFCFLLSQICSNTWANIPSQRSARPK